MLVTGNIVDNVTGEPLPGTTISLVNSAGVQSGVGVIADEEGAFALSESLLAPFGSFGLLVSHVGYQPVVVDPSFFVTNRSYGLVRNDDTMEEVVVTPGTGTTLPGGLLLAGVGAWLLFSGSKKKVSGVLDDNKVLYLGLGLGALGIVYFGIVNPILKKVGVKDSAETKRLDEVAKEAGSWWSRNFYLNGPADQRILPYNVARQYVEDIQSAFGWFTDDRTKVLAIFRSLETQSQASYLSYVFNTLTGEDLLSFLRGGSYPDDRLSDEDVAAINSFVTSLPKY